MTEAEWLHANARYMTAALGWIRALLRARAPVPLTSAATPPTSSAARFRWRRNAASRLMLPSNADTTPQAAWAEMEQASQAMTPPSALAMLAERLSLSPFEQHVLLLCAAYEIDPAVGPLCAAAQGDPARPFPSFALALSVFEDASWEVLSPEAALRRWRLIDVTQPGLPLTAAALRADERIVNLLNGISYLDDRLAGLVSTLAEAGPEIPASQQAMAEDALRQWRAAGEARARPVVQLLGADAASKRAVAGLVCAQLGLRPLRLDAALIPGTPGDLAAFARLWQREALLLPWALYIDADAAGEGQQAAVDRLLGRLDGTVLLATRELWPTQGEPPVAIDVRKPTAAEQLQTWRATLGEAAPGLPERMAGQFDLTAAAIGEIARRETLPAHEAEPAEPSATLADRVWDAARVLARPRLDMLARRMPARAEWADLVLPAPQSALLHGIADQVCARIQVYQDWGFADRMSGGLGISVMFAGPSGTGKTLAAQVLARHLRLDLFRIDLSTVVSKYIGETEGNLRRLFDAAEDGGAILFFDEADALFGKRSEVKESHDRYANIEIDYLLQRMEAFTGIAILATNMKGALDQAFLRRLRFVVDFPFPGVAERAAIWQRAFPAATPTDGLDFGRLARLNVAGGHIAVIALNAAFQAASAGSPVTMPMVLNAARTEFRKLGRPVNEPDFRWVKAA